MVNETGSEQTYVSNPFGTVTDKRVVYFRAKGWFSGGSREDIPLKHITSVRVDIKRHPVAAIVLGLIGLATLGSGEAGVVIGGLVLIAIAGLLLWGSPSVVVNTAGQDLSAARGFPWQRKERTPSSTLYVNNSFASSVTSGRRQPQHYAGRPTGGCTRTARTLAACERQH